MKIYTNNIKRDMMKKVAEDAQIKFLVRNEWDEQM